MNIENGFLSPNNDIPQSSNNDDIQGFPTIIIITRVSQSGFTGRRLKPLSVLPGDGETWDDF